MKRPTLKDIGQGFRNKFRPQDSAPDIAVPERKPRTKPDRGPELEIDPSAEMDAVMAMTSIASKWAETTELELTDRGKVASKAVERVFSEGLSAEEAWLVELTHWIAAMKVRDEKLLYIECLRFFIRHCHRELCLSSEFVGSINGAAADIMNPPPLRSVAPQYSQQPASPQFSHPPGSPFSHQPPPTTVTAPPPSQPPPQSGANQQTPVSAPDQVANEPQTPHRNLATLLVFTGALFPVFFLLMALLGTDPSAYRITQFSSEQWSVNPDNLSEAMVKSYDHTALAAVRFNTDPDCSPSQFFISKPGLRTLTASLLSGKRQSYYYQVDTQDSHPVRSTRVTDWRRGQIFDLGTVEPEDIQRLLQGSDLFYSRGITEPRTRFTLAGSDTAIEKARRHCLSESAPTLGS